MKRSATAQICERRTHARGHTNDRSDVEAPALPRQHSVLMRSAEASISIGGTPNHGSNKLAIGRAGEFATAPWNGWIDELRLSIGSRTEPPTRRGQRRGTDGTETAMGFQMIARVSM